VMPPRLKAEGHEVITARDGLDELRQLDFAQRQ
jgi:hypothetical protein